MKKEKETIEVIFRVYHRHTHDNGTTIENEVNAFFPKVFYKGDMIYYLPTCLAYADFCGRYIAEWEPPEGTRLATPKEYRKLFKAIKSMYPEYRFKVAKRFPSGRWYEKYNDILGKEYGEPLLDYTI